jgi:hypothetical protein
LLHSFWKGNREIIEQRPAAPPAAFDFADEVTGRVA